MSLVNRLPVWVHSFASDEGSLAEIIKALEQQVTSLESAWGIVEEEIKVDTALSLSLDATGALLNHQRSVDKSDADYRNELLTLVDDTTTQTVSTVEEIVRWITEYTPTVEEPDPGVMLVRLPINKTQYSADVMAQIGRIKAAGIKLLVGHLELWFESFSEGLLVEDYLFNALVGVFYDTFVTPWPLIGGSGQWDWGNWDALGAKWDSSEQPSDVLFWFGLQTFDNEFLTISYDEDDLFFIGILYPPSAPETLGTPTDALLLDGVLYLSNDLSGFYDESILLKGVLYGTESFSDYGDELDRIGLLFTEPTLPTPTDVMGGTITGYFIETPLDTPDEDILIAWSREIAETYPRRVARIGSARIGTHVIGFGVDITYNHEWDSGEWDYAWWDKSDSSDIVVVVREVF